jgi:hypothetical protein
MMEVHRDTVRRVWDASEPRKYRRAARASKLDGFKEQLLTRLASHPGLRATRLYGRSGVVGLLAATRR